MAIDHMSLFDAAGPLTAVRMFADRDLAPALCRIDLDFGGPPVRITVDRDTDEVRLLEDADADEWVEVPVTPLWRRALGHTPSWIWELRNNQGYNDGIQFEFKTAEGAQIIQIVGIASTLRVYEVSRRA